MNRSSFSCLLFDVGVLYRGWSEVIVFLPKWAGSGSTVNAVHMQVLAM
jgi:hypothetical protein